MKSIKIKVVALIFFVIILFSIPFFTVSCCKTEVVKLNNIQVIGSHNSYKKSIEKPLWDYLYQQDSASAILLQYEHIPIQKQLELGLRNLELDVFYDPEGGHFSNPKGLRIVKSLGKNPLEYDVENQLKKPGLKMFHIQDIDFRSHHLLFKDCLKLMKSWSNKNKNHTPIIVLINAKDKKLKGLKKPLPFTKGALDSIDKEILSVFSEQELITPDYVRGHFKTLEEAILNKGWPDLNKVNGRFLFVLDEKESKNRRYLEGHLVLKDRVMFVNVKEGNPEAAFRIINNPIKDFDYIKELVAKGYMVRTRADDGTKESRTNNYTKFNKAKASGAQIISTDYYIPTSMYKSKYKVVFKKGTYERIKNTK